MKNLLLNQFIIIIHTLFLKHQKMFFNNDDRINDSLPKCIHSVNNADSNVINDIDDINNSFVINDNNNINNRVVIITSNINNNDNNREDIDRRYSFSNSRDDNNTNEKVCQHDDANILVNIYRFKFTEDFMIELHNFSKIHQYDDRKAFKEAWVIWAEENSDLIDAEVTRLNNIGYQGNVLDKMFKSARYYFRKKSTEKKEPCDRKEYVGVKKEFLEVMDSHIRRNMKNVDYKPSNGFTIFCKENIELLKDEIAILCNLGYTDSNDIRNKIKKTYKNRYFILINK